MAKAVVEIAWTSQDGQVLFREVYDDGSRGALVSAGFENNDPAMVRKMREVEKKRIGKKADK